MAKTAIVVGGGIVGSAVAAALVGDGWTVSLYDRGNVFGETSSTAAGLLGFEAEARHLGYPRWLDEARDLWEPWVRNLEELSGLSSGFGRIGILHPVSSASDLAAWGPSGNGRAVEALNASDLDWRGRYHRDLAGGLLLTTDARIDPRLLGEVIAKALPRLGVDVHTSDGVTALMRDGERVVGIQSTSGSHTADLVVLATGFSTSPLIEPLGWSLPVKPVRGQVVALDRPDWWPRYTIQTEEWYAIPRDNGSLVMGSTWEEDVWEAKSTLEGVLDIGRRMLAVFPDLAGQPVRGTWAGLRPVSEDEEPYIGSLPGVAGLMIAVGHGHHGLMLAPWTGRMVAAMAQGAHRAEWDAYAPARASQNS